MSKLLFRAINLDNFEEKLFEIKDKYYDLKNNLEKLECPIIFFENDSKLPEKLSNLTKSKNFFFGIPDVITSNTAPQNLLDNDDLSIVTEDGQAFADISAKDIGGNIKYVSSKELKTQWLAKLYLRHL